MRPRPPTLRDKKRYILVRITPPWITADTKSLYHAIHKAVTSLWGDEGSSRIQVAVMYGEPEFCIIRCRRGCEQKLGIAITMVRFLNDQPVSLRSLAVSGTIRSLREKIEALRKGPYNPDGNMDYKGTTYEVFRLPSGRIDLLEKGFKSRELLFLTDEDLEEK